MPVFGALLIRVARRLAQLEDRWSSAIVALLALAGAWVWRLSGGESVVLGWDVISFVGAPLVIDAQAANAALVIALAAARLARVMDPGSDGAPARTMTAAAHFSAAVLACLARSVPMLLIGLGICSLSALWLAARRANGHQAIRTFAPQALALVLAPVGFYLHAPDGLLPTPASNGVTRASDLVTTLFGLAVLLHAGIGVRNTVSTDGESAFPQSAQQEAGVIGAALLLRHAPTPPLWLTLAGATLALIWAVRAITASTGAAQRHAIRQAATALLLVAASAVERTPDAPLTFALAWVLGSLLLVQLPLLRLGSLLLFAGLPPLAGFGSHALAFNALTQAGAPGIVTLLLALCAMALFMAALLKCVFGLEAVNDALRGLMRSVAGLAREPVRLIALAHALLFGVASSLAGRTATATINAPAGIALLAATLLVGVFVWRFLDRERVMESFDQTEAGIDRVAAGMSIAEGALERMRAGLRVVFVFLESDGALLWACLLVLIALLIGRSAQP